MNEINRTNVFQLISELNSFVSESEELISRAFSSFSGAEEEIEKRKKEKILELEKWHASSLDNIECNRDDIIKKVEATLSRIDETDSIIRKNDSLYAKMVIVPPSSCREKASLYLSYSTSPIKKLEEFEKSYIDIASKYVKEKTGLSGRVFNRGVRTTDFTELVAISQCIHQIGHETIDNLNQIFTDEKTRIDIEYDKKNKDIDCQYEKEISNYNEKKEELILSISNAVITQLDSISSCDDIKRIQRLGELFSQKLLGFTESLNSPIALCFVNYNLDEFVCSQVIRETLMSKYSSLISERSISFPLITTESDIKPVYISCLMNEAAIVYDYYSSIILGCLSNIPVGDFRCFFITDDTNNENNQGTFFPLLKRNLVPLFDVIKGTNTGSFSEMIEAIKKRVDKRNSMHRSIQNSNSERRELELIIIAILDDLDDTSLTNLISLIEESDGFLIPLIVDFSKEKRLSSMIRNGSADVYSFLPSKGTLSYRGLEVSISRLPVPDQVEKYLSEYKEKYVAYRNEKMLCNLGIFNDEYKKNATEGLLLPVMSRFDEENELCFLPIGTGVSTHTLITGNTSSGKSSFLHLIITSIITNYHPDDVELWLVDYGKVEFANYIVNRPPHIRFISLEKTEMFTYSFLDYLKEFFSRREKMLIDSGVSSIQEFREKNGWLSLPRVVLIIDEFHVMTQHIVDSMKHRVILENALAEYRKLGLSCIFSNQTLSGLRGLSDTGLLQIKNRIAMTNTLQEMTDTLMVQRSNYTDEMYMSMERTRVGEFWFKEWVSPSDFLINKFRAMYLNGTARSEAIEKVIRRDITTCCDTEVFVIEGDKRISVEDGLRSFSPRGSSIAIRVGVPSSIGYFFDFHLEQRYNNNVLIVGSDYELRADLIVSMIDCCYYNSNVKPLIIADPNDEMISSVSLLLEKLGLSVTIIDEYGEICKYLRKVVDDVNSRNVFSERVIVFWFGIKDLFEEFKVLPEKRTVLKEEKKEKERESISLNDSDLKILEEDEELSRMASGMGMSVSQLLENMSISDDDSPDLKPEQNQEISEEYNAYKDVLDIVAKGSKLGLFSVCCIDRLNDLNRFRDFDLDTFNHRLIQSTSRDEAYNLGVGKVIDDVTPGLNVVYSNGVISEIVKPFIIK